MKDINILPFKPWHMKLFEPGELFVPELQSGEAAAWGVRQLEAMTLLIDGEIVAIMGIMPLWNGVGEVTMLPSNQLYRHKKTVIRKLRSILAGLQHVGWRRLFCNTRTDRPMHGRFMQALGFQYEGTMKQYAPDGSDRDLYALVGGD